MKRKIQFFITILLLIFAEESVSQTTFQKKFGGSDEEWGRFIQQTNDGGYIFGGTKGDYFAGSQDIILIKTDMNGDTVWAKTYGGQNNDEGNWLEQTSDGGYVIAGTTSSFGAGSSDVYLIKTDSIGDTLWTKTYGTTFSNGAYCVRQTSDGGYIITGYTGLGVYLIKINSNGNLLWKKTYGGNSSDSDIGVEVQETNDGGYILVCNSIANFGNSISDVVLIKTNSIGDTLWTKTYSVMTNTIPRCVQQTNDGGYIITGSTDPAFAAYTDIFLIKTDTLGLLMWTKTYGNVVSDDGYFVRQTSDGGYIILGNSMTPQPGSANLIKTNLNGDTLWTKHYKLGGGILNSRNK